MTEESYKSPFPWFGGKSKAADLIWSRLGSDVKNYCEPFLGSAAVFLRRPKEFSGWITLNDFDGLLVNFCRSVSKYPAETAQAAAQPVFEADEHARHLALVTRKADLIGRLMADIDYCEPELAGWWAWGACVWIGSGWCSGKGPWVAVKDSEGYPVLRKGDNGKGVNRQLPHLGNNGKGVNRQLVRIDSGVGCIRNSLGNGSIAGTEKRQQESIIEWFQLLRDNFRNARVACGDWQRVYSPETVTRNGIAGVLLDPPYSQTRAVYAEDSSTIAHDVRAWCVANGDNPKLRIALCGHDTEHNELEGMGWSVETWAKGGGYQGADDRERIWFSPHCVGAAVDDRQVELFAL
jgi:site-specific DNA-adenine methylase